MVNLTPHEIVIHTATGEVVRIPASGKVARVATKTVNAESIVIDGVTVETAVTEYGQVEWPEGVDISAGVIVSAIVAGRCIDVPGVFSPDTGGGAVRDEQGRILGTRRLLRA